MFKFQNSKTSKALSKIALVLLCGTALTAALPIATPPSLGFLAAAHAGQQEDHRAALARYGAFQPHAKYGEVWVPAETTAPVGWHPYPPCNWVHQKEIGWYFDDKTEWGRIVHHYGRWAHDASLGWVWVAGGEFSPGWVVWRSSERWVGWAPMPPDVDVKTISATEFNSDKHWIFVEARQLSNRCEGGSGIATVKEVPTLIETTKVVTEFRFVKGIAVFVLPPPLFVNIVDIDIDVFAPWSPCFLGGWLWNWNLFAANIVIVAGPGPLACPMLAPKPKPPILPIVSSPPPPPGSGSKPPKNDPPRFEPPKPDRRVELPKPIDPPKPPRFDPPAFDPVIVRPRPIDPVVLRPFPPPVKPPVVRLPDPPRPPKGDRGNGGHGNNGGGNHGGGRDDGGSKGGGKVGHSRPGLNVPPRIVNVKPRHIDPTPSRSSSLLSNTRSFASAKPAFSSGTSFGGPRGPGGGGGGGGGGGRLR